ncbi:MAG: hypothetical protein EOP60_03380 [Sphingomonadales bacterium]|nr:MAG: hypothetical protein EOP60_03380 [Sphingomonadales bacterium]
MRTVVMLGGLLALAACGGGGTTGTNYSEAPPVAEIVATPTPKPSETPTPEPEAPAVDAAENAAGNAL